LKNVISVSVLHGLPLCTLLAFYTMFRAKSNAYK